MSFEAIAEICALNKKLLHLTGCDIAKEVIKIANNEKKTEIDAKIYLKNRLAEFKEVFLSSEVDLFLDLYLFWVEFRERESEAKFATLCEVVNCNDEPFRSRHLNNFLVGIKKEDNPQMTNEQIICYCDDVVGFFDKN
jgi:hypothetical protein